MKKRKIKVALGLSGGVDPGNTLTGSRGLRPRVARARLRGKFRVAVGLSGGVDSAVSTLLLQEQGFDISGVYLNCFDSDIPGCRGDQDRKDALAVAMHLGLPFQVLDFRKEYQAAVIDYFKKEYLAGRTPNPDVVCNRDIKFGLFLDWAIKAGFDYVATGHYADGPRFLLWQKSVGTPAPANDRSMSRASNEGKANAKTWLGATSVLRIPKDLHKDQTYFLWAVPRQKFKRVLFPLGDLLKSEVREIARKAGLIVADKRDSVGICFVGEISAAEFLKRLGVKEKPGDVVDASGRVIGVHHGVPFYTIGQRHRFEVNSKFSDKPPLYVIEKDVRRNRLIVGFGAETYRSQFVVSDCNWLAPIYDLRFMNYESTLVRIRHCGELISCAINASTHQRINVSLSEAQRGIAPGQSAVFYTEKGVVLGGGVILL